MNMHDVAYTAVQCSLNNFRAQLNGQLDKALTHYTKAAMLAPLGKDSFMLSGVYRGFTVERDNLKVTLTGLCNAYGGMFGTDYREEQRFADQLAYQFKDYVEAWFEHHEEIAAREGQEELQYEFQFSAANY